MADAVQSFADLIADGRRAKGWSQDDLERESGVSRSTISRWERGLADRPEPEHVRAVCAALGVDPRRAAVSLGYLTEDDLRAGQDQLPQEVEEVLDILQSGSISAESRREWINYLKYLQQASTSDRQTG
ncbi:helix-turn-helix domain-containing protein [Paractinoplanes deccanensis]|nr:helix-turn-helix transcriptional regulator [Actinoplanes deccanensis]